MISKCTCVVIGLISVFVIIMFVLFVTIIVKKREKNKNLKYKQYFGGEHDLDNGSDDELYETEELDEESDSELSDEIYQEEIDTSFEWYQTADYNENLLY